MIKPLPSYLPCSSPVTWKKLGLLCQAQESLEICLVNLVSVVHALADLIYDIFHQLGSVLKTINISSEYIVDSFPVPVCDNIRISRCKIAKSEDFRGYIASKRRYFYGVRVHVPITSDGIPVELAFTLNTLKGFLLKICLFVFAYTLEKAFL